MRASPSTYGMRESASWSRPRAFPTASTGVAPGAGLPRFRRTCSIAFLGSTGGCRVACEKSPFLAEAIYERRRAARRHGCALVRPPAGGRRRADEGRTQGLLLSALSNSRRILTHGKLRPLQ